MIALDTGWHDGDTTTPHVPGPFPSLPPSPPAILTSPPLPLPASHPPQDVVRPRCQAPLDLSVAPGDRRVPSARCPRVQSALASLSATPDTSARLFVNHDVCVAALHR